MSEVRRDLRIRGRVQGVGFRWWTSRTACAFRVRGAVKNAPDGTVEVRMAGAPGAVARLELALREGPPVASVESIEEIPAVGLLPEDGFETW